tara:strand:+ start:252 stop:1163 length:912 start_codon:yes stop_codon:yes gene_type:complete
MAFQNLCPPALIYLIFSITQVVIDTMKGLYNTALVKVWVAFVFTILLNYLCQLGLGIISWFIVFIPFLLMTLVVAILLLMFGLDPSTGKIKITDPNKVTDKNDDHTHHKHDSTHDTGHGHHPPAARDDKEIKKKEQPVMKYYKSMKSGGGGSSILENETPRQKTNRILSKSLLFYTETESDDPKKNNLSLDTKVDDTNNNLDTRKYQLFVDTVTSILSGMGESEIASDLQIKSNACINSAKKMDKISAKKSITECFNGLMTAIYNKFSPEKAESLKRNIRESICKDNEPDISCKKRLEDNWWN